MNTQGYVHFNDSNSMVICMYCRPYLSKQSLVYQLTGLLNNNAANPSSQLQVYTVEIISSQDKLYHYDPKRVETVEAKWCSEQNCLGRSSKCTVVDFPSNVNLLLFSNWSLDYLFHFGVSCSSCQNISFVGVNKCTKSSHFFCFKPTDSY